MTEDEFMALSVMRKAALTCFAINGSDRTLLYGYDCERNTWHTYQAGGILYHVVYNHQGDLVWGFAGECPCADVIPNKRLYPEACDIDFCRLLTAKGVSLPFTKYDAERAAKRGSGPFFGKRLEELTFCAA